MSERDPRFVAQLLLAQLGLSAVPFARERLEDFRSEHDASAAQAWMEILAELVQLTASVGTGLLH